jgi:uncharacterized protein with NRDE domain
MCTLIALHHRIPGVVLAVAANRDEFFDRPTQGPALRRTPYGVIVAPRDERAGGTWLGLNGNGVFAALTNRPCPDADPTRRSRGLLVIDALGASRAADAAERVAALPPNAYNPFTLYLADREEAFAVTYDRVPTPVVLGDGVHVIGNADPNGPPTPKLARLSERAERAAAGPAADALDRLADISRAHDGGGSALADACVHSGSYGTRSSTLLRLGDKISEGELRYSDGPPCETRYDDFSPLLRALEPVSGAAETT